MRRAVFGSLPRHLRAGAPSDRKPPQRAHRSPRPALSPSTRRCGLSLRLPLRASPRRTASPRATRHRRADDHRRIDRHGSRPRENAASAVKRNETKRRRAPSSPVNLRRPCPRHKPRRRGPRGRRNRRARRRANAPRPICRSSAASPAPAGSHDAAAKSRRTTRSPNTLTASPAITSAAPASCACVSRSSSSSADDARPTTGTSSENGATCPAG